jgi:hypothetical protein
MTLSEWAAQHRDEVIAEDATRTAIAPLLAVIAREITDAEGVPSDDGRLEHAFTACLTVARMALVACGYRLRSTAHHYLAIESLQYTLGLTEAEVSQLQRLRRMRARAMYEQVGIASREDAQAALAAARAVAARLNEWLAREHPDKSE